MASTAKHGAHARGGSSDDEVIVLEEGRQLLVGKPAPSISETDVDEHKHYSQRAPWLRAFILGANDGLCSVASVMIGVGGGMDQINAMRLSGLAALVAGALSMACGEYISVAGQKDAEEADIETERREQAKGPHAQQKELEELTQIYVERGLEESLARQVAEQLSAKDVIRAHARDELGIDVDELANPWQAAVVSALAFTCGASLPLLCGWWVVDHHTRVIAVAIASALGFLAFGVIGALLGGANVVNGALRVLIGGCLAMAASFGVGKLFHVSVSG